MLVAGCAAAIVLAAAQLPNERRPEVTMAPVTALRDASTSTNWAGYAAMAPGASFSDVKGTWIEPAVDCSTGLSASAFWVGLGGMTASSLLEQIGTSADCDELGSPSYYAWYELVPAPAIPVALAVAPGDTISAEVSAVGATITLRLDNVTNGQTFSTQATVDRPDLSSADWIAEAPSVCSTFNPNGCTVLPLSNFGTAAFTAGSATVAGHGGPIADPAWSADRIQLVAATGEPVADASDLAPDGSSFTVEWHSTGAALRLLPLGFVATPRLPRAGHTFTATLAVAATNPAALVDATTTCSASISGVPVKARARSFAGRTAVCVWAIPARASGKLMTGTVTATARNAKLSRRFSYRIR